MGRVGSACFAAITAAVAWGCLTACEAFSLDGLTGGDAGEAASGWLAGGDAGGDGTSATTSPGDATSSGLADAPHDVDLADAAPADDAALGDGACGPEAGESGGPTDAPIDEPPPPPTYRIVFVTPQISPGSLGGTGAGDTTCQGLASQYGLPGTYLAWLSDSSVSPASRMKKATVPYVLPDRSTVVAVGWTQLVSGNLAHAIDQTAQGSTVTSAGQSCNGTAGYYVWTGTTTAGASWNSYTCNAWNTASPGNLGGVGDALEQNADWTQWCQATCNVLAAIYCVEQ
jgi:hypothetical protein